MPDEMTAAEQRRALERAVGRTLAKQLTSELELSRERERALREALENIAYAQHFPGDELAALEGCRDSARAALAGQAEPQSATCSRPGCTNTSPAHECAMSGQAEQAEDDS